MLLTHIGVKKVDFNLDLILIATQHQQNIQWVMIELQEQILKSH
jgi:hypothetical protein